MANWCSNSLVIRGSSEYIRDLQSKVTKTDDNGKTYIDILGSLFPTPTELATTMSGSFPKREDVDKTPEQIAWEEQQQKNIAQHGYADWYDWNVANWGTKWGDSDTELVHDDAGSLHFVFHTAWSPPLEGIKTISTLFPELLFIMSWEEEGMDFYGASVMRNGETTMSEGEISSIDGWCPVDYEQDDWQDQADKNSDLLVAARENCEELSLEQMGVSW